MFINKLVFVLTVFCLLSTLHKGEAQVDVNRHFDITSLEINRNNGSAATKNKMLVSRDGFLWYTTYNGLVKHYGSTSVVFPFDESTKEGIGIFFDLFEDRDGNMWIATDQGLYFFNIHKVNGILYTWENPETEVNAMIRSIAQSATGDIIATTDSRYVLEYNMDSKQIVSHRIPDTYYEEPPDAYAYGNYYVQLEETFPDGGIAMSQFNKFYRYLDGEVTMLKDYSKAKQLGGVLNKFELLENGSVFPKGESGTFTFGGRTFIYDYISVIDRHLVQFSSRDFRILESWQDGKKTIQFCKIDPKNQRRLLFSSFDIESGRLIQDNREIIFDGVISDLIHSHKEIFYVTTSQKIYAVRPKQDTFETFLTDELEHEELERISTRGFAQNDDGEIFVSTYSGLYTLNPLSKKAVRVDDSFIEEVQGVSPLYRELLFRDGYLWSGGEESLFRRIDLVKKSVQNYSLRDARDDKSLRILSWAPWGENRLLIGTNAGLFSFDFGTEEIIDQSVLNERNNLSGENVQYIYVESETKVWLATRGAGVFIKDFSDNSVNQITQNNTDQILGSNIIFTIHKGLDEMVYFGTYGGLSSLDKNHTIINNTVKEGLSNNVVVGIQENSEGLWLSTYNGLVAYNKEDNRFYNFYKKDGLPDNEFNQQSSFKDRDGKLYFGGLNGFARFNPEKVIFRGPSERIEVVGVEFFDKNLGSVIRSSLNLEERLDRVIIPYDKNFFNISYAIPDPFNTYRPIFEYNLRGQSSDWISLGTDTTLRLNALSPGDYNLNIRGKDASGNRTINNLSIPIRVEQIFYRKPWFVILSILTILLLILGFYQFRQYRWKEKLKQQRIVDQLESKALRAQMNPHFIFNTLNGLQSTMILKGEKAANKYLGAFSTLLRSTLDMSKSDTICLAEEIKYLSAYLSLEKLRQARELESSISWLPKDMDLESIFIPCMIFQPLLENAILHGLAPKREGESKVDMHFIEENGKIKGVVTDNGIGRKAAAELKAKNRKSHKSWATSIMEERIEIINKYTSNSVDFYIEDLYENDKSRGTRVTVILPILSEIESKKIMF